MKKSLYGYVLLMCLMALTLCGCHSRQKIVYVQGAAEVGTLTNVTPYEACIAPDDQLTILVTCSDLPLAVPFNLQRPQASMAEGGGSNSTNYQDNENLYYRVDSEGYILFPTIGRLKVQGMTRRQLAEYLMNYLRDSGYIQDPLVNISFVGAHYSVLGEVNAPGRVEMRQERVTLFEALAAAGDMTIYGERDKVRLIRPTTDGQQVVSLNLKDPAVMQSPYFYIQHGDVLYVEPNGTRAANREVSSLQSLAISVTSILITVASLIVTITR